MDKLELELKIWKLLICWFLKSCSYLFGSFVAVFKVISNIFGSNFYRMMPYLSFYTVNDPTFLVIKFAHIPWLSNSNVDLTALLDLCSQKPGFFYYFMKIFLPCLFYFIFSLISCWGSLLVPWNLQSLVMDLVSNKNPTVNFLSQFLYF